ncbi:MAG TPA: DNRLRE domain-containing protein, partial [Tepidisphaeraceae bacterium]|nr:DNRLRE domain-containing protein [Tepidisphaeraceae bacterium]
PAVGSTISLSGAYARRHNPVVNWQATNPDANQYGPSHNMPLTDFPTDFTQLPTFSFVVPNNDNNMHDGTVAEADAWLQTNIKPYADWAMTHNSLLVITWDEDEVNPANRNRIPTIFHGPMIKPSEQAATWTVHNLLRTIEEMHGATHAGAAKLVKPIVGPFVGDPELITTRFQQGSAGYASTSDTHLESAMPTTNHGGDTSVAVTSTITQGLIRFDDIFGNGLGQAPLGAKVLSAKLLLVTTATDLSAETISLHGMLSNWSENSTWNSLGGGVSIDDDEAVSIAEFRVTPNVALAPAIFDVSRSVATWAADPSQNHGWLLRGSTPADLWRWRSSENATATDHPILEITYERPHWSVDASGQWSAGSNWISGLPAGPGAKANFLRNISAPRTIGISAPITVGSIIFESDIPYTLAGASITLASLPGVPTTIDTLAGTHTILADVHLQDDTPITIGASARLDITGPLTIAGGKTITKSGPGTLHAAGGISGAAGTLVIEQGVVEAKHFNGFVSRFSAGARAIITPDGTIAATSKLLSLEFDGSAGAWQGQLDLTNNALIVQADSATRLAVLTRIADQIATARNSGEARWTGQGLTSSSAAASRGLFGLSILLNDNGAGAPLHTTFAGQPADLNSILITYTLVGDMDLDHDIDADDYARIDAGYAKHLAGYWNGDLDYNGRINSDDFFLIDRAFSSSFNEPPGALAAPSAAVPEPAAIGLGAILAAALTLRIRRLCFSTPSSPAPAPDRSPR